MRDRYSLAAETLESPSVKLNGQILHPGRNDNPPAVRGTTVKAGASTLQPATITFLTFATFTNIERAYPGC
jgi:heparanase